MARHYRSTCFERHPGPGSLPEQLVPAPVAVVTAPRCPAPRWPPALAILATPRQQRLGPGSASAGEAEIKLPPANVVPGPSAFIPKLALGNRFWRLIHLAERH
jgi:hypothetical protein